MLGLLNSIQPVGALVALPFITWVVDKWGRRWSIVFGASWTIVGAILQASSKEIPQFVIARFLIGWGLAYTIVGSPLLLVELALPKHRGSVISYFPTVWYLGAIVAAWTTFGTRKIDNAWSWRIPSLLQGLPAIVQVVGIFFVPESPRWLISKGRGAEAKAILVKYHANGIEGNFLVELEYHEIKEAIATDQNYKAKSNWLDLVRTSPNRRRIFITFFCGLFIEVWSITPAIAFDYAYLALQRYPVTVSSNTTFTPSLLASASLVPQHKQQSTAVSQSTTLSSQSAPPFL